MHDPHFSLAPALFRELRFVYFCPVNCTPEPTHIFVDKWGYLAQLDQDPDLNHRLTSRRYGPPREFPKSPH